MNPLISLALEALTETVATEIRRMGREVQMAKLNGHPDEPVNENNLVCEPPTLDPHQSRMDRLIQVAHTEWMRGVTEPVSGGPKNGAARIDEYIRGASGLGWSTAELGPTARPNIPYTKNGMFEWCGAFAAWCYGQVGLKPLIRKKNIASTYRLFVWSNGNARRIPLRDIQPGDIVVIGPEGDADGAHVTIASTALKPDGTFETYEGNAGGKKPDGTKHEGVIKSVRSIHGKTSRDYRAVFAVRPLEGEDYV